MNKILKAYDKSIFQFFDHIIKVNFPFKSSSISFKETQITILKLINKNSEITQKIIAVEMGLTERAIKKAMVTLTKNGIIKRIGSNRKGRWIVLK
ncbi:MAG: winged helix-turn-helix transcriptional regulator [Anaerorhabdus sp.]